MPTQEGTTVGARMSLQAPTLDALTALHIRPLYHETAVYSAPGRYQYAGTADLIAMCEDASPLGPGPVIVDIKTGKDVYPGDALQVTAYARVSPM